MVVNWLLAHLACGLAAALIACVAAELHKPRIR